MGDRKTARTELASAPQRYVEVEHARTPAATAAAPKIAFDLLQLREHFERFEIAFNKCDGIGEIAACRSVSGIEDDWRSIEQPELLVEPRDRRLDDARRAAMAAVGPVRPECANLLLGVEETAGLPRVGVYP